MKLRRVIIVSLGALGVLLGMFLCGPDTGFCALAIWPFDFCDWALGGWPPGIYWVLLWLGKGMLCGVVFEGGIFFWRLICGVPLLVRIARRPASIPRTAARILDNSPMAVAALGCYLTFLLTLVRFADFYGGLRLNLAQLFWPVVAAFVMLYTSPIRAAAGKWGRIVNLVAISCGIYVSVLLIVIFLIYGIILLGSIALRN